MQEITKSEPGGLTPSAQSGQMSVYELVINTFLGKVDANTVRHGNSSLQISHGLSHLNSQWKALHGFPSSSTSFWCPEDGHPGLCLDIFSMQSLERLLKKIFSSVSSPFSKKIQNFRAKFRQNISFSFTARTKTPVTMKCKKNQPLSPQSLVQSCSNVSQIFKVWGLSEKDWLSLQ